MQSAWPWRAHTRSGASCAETSRPPSTSAFRPSSSRTHGTEPAAHAVESGGRRPLIAFRLTPCSSSSCAVGRSDAHRAPRRPRPSRAARSCARRRRGAPTSRARCSTRRRGGGRSRPRRPRRRCTPSPRSAPQRRWGGRAGTPACSGVYPPGDASYSGPPTFALRSRRRRTLVDVARLARGIQRRDAVGAREVDRRARVAQLHGDARVAARAREVHAGGAARRAGVLVGAGAEQQLDARGVAELARRVERGSSPRRRRRPSSSRGGGGR